MQVSSRREKAKGTKEEIEKALLTYCSQLGNFEVGCVCVCVRATQLPHTWLGRVNAAGFSVLHQPNVAVPWVMTGELNKLPQIFEYAKPSNL